tara:strand:+ start:84 stop:707 length:624 start_codon:yes stop_codon:yes gene_type:complete
MIKGIKICGISDEITLNYLINHEFAPQYIGFITNYKKSKRYVEFNKLKELTNMNNGKINFVSVLVDPDDKILEKIKNLKFDYLQLYDVDPNRTKFIKKKYNTKIISALTVKNKADVEAYKSYQDISDIILFDGKGYEKSIGFDHSLLDNLPNTITKMVAGNLKIDNIPKLNNSDFLIDLSGSLENEEGKKDLQKIDLFLKNIKKNEN